MSEKHSEEIDQDLINKGQDVISDFDENDAITIPAHSSKSKPISIRLPIEMMRDLRKIASATGEVGYQRLIKRFITEGLAKHNERDSEKDASIHHKLELLQRQVSAIFDQLQEPQNPLNPSQQEGIRIDQSSSLGPVDTLFKRMKIVTSPIKE